MSITRMSNEHLCNESREGDGDPVRDWYAFRVRPRHEKSVALQLGDKKQESFLPLVKQARRWANRTSHVDLPVIPGYIFCRSHRFGLLPILQTPGVIDVVRAGRTPAAIPAEEVYALERAIQAAVPLEPYPYYEIGDKVEIREGPLAGVSGTVVKHRNVAQLVLSVAILRRSVLVHVDVASLCEPSRIHVAGRDQVA